MKRSHFLKRLVQIGAGIFIATPLLSSESKESNMSQIKKYKFDDLFYRSDGNSRLIYPKTESEFYKEVYSKVSDRTSDSAETYLPVHRLMIPIKDEYSEDELKPIIYYFENVYSKCDNFSNRVGSIFRMIQDKPDRMYLEVFLGYSFNKI